MRRFSTVTAAAASYDLTTKEAAKIELAISGTSDDAFLAQAVSQASSAIASYCNRVFAVERLQDSFYLLDTDRNFNVDSSADVLQLARDPAITIVSLTEAGTALVEGTDFLVDRDNAQILRLGKFGEVIRWTCAPLVVSYDAGFGAKANEAFAIPATPFKVTVSKASTFAVDEGVTKSDGTVFTKVSGAPAANQYQLGAGGQYTFAAADEAADITIQYSYNSAPADLALAALRLVVMRYKGKDRDPMKISHSEPGIGEDRWWVGGFSGQAFPPEVEGLIAPYRVVPV